LKIINTYSFLFFGSKLKKEDGARNEAKRLIIALGYNCNNDCIFCGISAKKRTKTKSKEEIKGRLLKARKDGIEKIVFSGGEPTIHEAFIELIDFAKKQRFREIEIMTNGRAFSDKVFAKKVVDSGAKKFLFNIISHKQNVHDFITQRKGSFAETVEGIKNLKKLGAKIEGNLLVLKQNYKSLRKTIEFFSKLGLSKIYISFPEFRGDAKKHKGKIKVDPKKASPFILKCFAPSNSNVELEFINGSVQKQADHRIQQSA